MKAYYHAGKKALVHCDRTATAAFWDNHWDTTDFARQVRKINPWLVTMTQRYLPASSTMLEGGCGQGNNVFSLQEAGYKAYGLDFAQQTVVAVKKAVPTLPILEGDVRHLPFGDKVFDGYWSIGVIEHFYEGFAEIAQEMARVIRPGGYLFLSFPWMSPLRRLQARLHLYPLLPAAFLPEQEKFYQFVLDADSTATYFHKSGFTLQKRQPLDGLKGLKDEISFLKPLLQQIYDSRSGICRVIKKVLDILFREWCGHSILLVLRRHE